MKTLIHLAEISEFQKLRFIVIGGYAVIAWGVPRQTIDLDVLIDATEKDAWAKALAKKDFRLESEQTSFMQWACPDRWRLDLMIVQPPTFEKLWAASELRRINGASARIASIEHLIALKLHALKHGSAERKFKDFTDVLRLVHIGNIDLHGVAFKELCLKHGTAKLHEDILYFSQS